jgi:hypothetical protein
LVLKSGDSLVTLSRLILELFLLSLGILKLYSQFLNP